ncbi:MAG: MBL fold metallo-hydrolase [Proteobacteria bacterium]|nr:MBL fold metallo-hydrolase [Pseudomonadota bacterium]
MLPAHTDDLGDGVYAIDTGFQRPRFDAAYLVVDGGKAAFIDSGTNHSVPRLLEALAGVGLAADAVQWVIPTHVHLDHAGGVGELMARLPTAQVLAHPRGARHIVDPRALYEGALAVYGQAEMDRSYGRLLPVPAERVLSSHDEQVIHVGQRPLRLIDSPGHARHHHAIWDERSRGWFTGDTFGLSYREHDVEGRPWIFPTTTPVQFDPEAMRASVARMLAAQPACVYLTHYSRVRNVPQLATQLLNLLDQVVAIGEQLRHAPQRHAALRQALTTLYVDSLHAHGSPYSAAEIAAQLEVDIELNAQGMGVWLGAA